MQSIFHKRCSNPRSVTACTDILIFLMTACRSETQRSDCQWHIAGITGGYSRFSWEFIGDWPRDQATECHCNFYPPSSPHALPLFEFTAVNYLPSLSAMSCFTSEQSGPIFAADGSFRLSSLFPRRAVYNDLMAKRLEEYNVSPSRGFITANPLVSDNGTGIRLSQTTPFRIPPFLETRLDAQALLDSRYLTSQMKRGNRGETKTRPNDFQRV